MDDKKRTLYTFQNILEFVTDLHEVIGTSQKALTMYYRLLTKAPVSDQKILKRHVECFKKFCVINRSAICEKNINKLSAKRIEFTDRIFIDIPRIFKLLDREGKATMWKYLLTISAIIDEESTAKEVLNQPKGADNVIAELMSTVQDELTASNIEVSDNPMEMVMSLMTSGAIENIMSSFQDKMSNGEIDMMSMLSAAQSMTQNIQEDAESVDNPMLKGLVENMTGMMANIESQIPEEEDIGVEHVD